MSRLATKVTRFYAFFFLNIHTKVIVTVSWWSFKMIFKVMIFFSLYVKLMSNTVCLIIMDMQVNANQWPPLFLFSCQKLTMGRLLSLLLQMSTYRNILIDPLNKIIQTTLKGVFLPTTYRTRLNWSVTTTKTWLFMRVIRLVESTSLSRGWCG